MKKKNLYDFIHFHQSVIDSHVYCIFYLEEIIRCVQFYCQSEYFCLHNKLYLQAAIIEQRGCDEEQLMKRYLASFFFPPPISKQYTKLFS